MTANLLGSLALAVAIAVAMPALAQNAAPGNPSSDDIIKALKPDEGMKTRGLHILSAQPAGGGATATQAPAISLNVTFALGSADLTPDAKEVVRRLATAMNSDQLATYKFQVEGHTDSTGTPDANLDLSQRRANAVRDDLIAEYHVSPDKLVAVGKGQTEPLDAAHPEAAANRRVQIVNLGAQ
jgi:outer membrane protein OmpA-like peptidoglycan-associated protein